MKISRKPPRERRGKMHSVVTSVNKSHSKAIYITPATVVCSWYIHGVAMLDVATAVKGDRSRFLVGEDGIGKGKGVQVT